MERPPPGDAGYTAGMEQELRVLSVAITEPLPGECLVCYVVRMLDFGCKGHRWLERYRDLRAPRATAPRSPAGCGWAGDARAGQAWATDPADYFWMGSAVVAGMRSRS